VNGAFIERSSATGYKTPMPLLSTVLTTLAAAAASPGGYTTDIDNPYLPLRPGARWVYRVREGDEVAREVVTVTHRTKLLASGVTARAVTDVERLDGKLVEKTTDYYAQDEKGAVWYLGEDTVAYDDNGEPESGEGSFEAGRDGAEGGIAMPAHPKPGFSYKQEDYKGHAEDRGRIVAVGEQAQTPLRHFRKVVMTRDTNRLEPRALEFKFYARGVGPVLAIDVSGGAAREDLVRFRDGR
jgi:hypothetical protein